MSIKGIRREWKDKNFFVVVDCNDGRWAIGATDDIFKAWEMMDDYPGSYFVMNEQAKAYSFLYLC